MTEATTGVLRPGLVRLSPTGCCSWHQLSLRDPIPVNSQHHWRHFMGGTFLVCTGLLRRLGQYRIDLLLLASLSTWHKTKDEAYLEGARIKMQWLWDSMKIEHKDNIAISHSQAVTSSTHVLLTDWEQGFDYMAKLFRCNWVNLNVLDLHNYIVLIALSPLHLSIAVPSHCKRHRVKNNSL